ncbi:hypothetical protein QP162_11005 [Sphingomonas aurantiaca]
MLAVAGRLVPHVAIGTAWLCLWLVWLTLGQGFAFTGAIGLVAIGGLLLFVASAAIAALLILLTGEVATSLSASVIYAGSALAYSGASLPITGGLAFARIWSAILPLTHYVTLEMDQAIGVDLAVWAKQAAILLWRRSSRAAARRCCCGARRGGRHDLPPRLRKRAARNPADARSRRGRGGVRAFLRLLLSGALCASGRRAAPDRGRRCRSQRAFAGDHPQPAGGAGGRDCGGCPRHAGGARARP